MYGSEFQYCLEAISSRSEVAAFCYECQRVCPIGRDEFQVAHQNMDIDTEFYREALPSGGPLFISESLYQDHKNYILKYSNVQQKFAKGAAVDRGKSDRELAQELGLTPKEVREIRCRARLEMVSYEDWHKADEFKDTRCQQFLKSFYRRSS
jgi:hypothetical protein